jgi:hypothetical protein
MPSVPGTDDALTKASATASKNRVVRLSDSGLGEVRYHPAMTSHAALASMWGTGAIAWITSLSERIPAYDMSYPEYRYRSGPEIDGGSTLTGIVSPTVWIVNAVVTCPNPRRTLLRG